MKNLCKNSAQYQKKNLFRYNPKLYISRLVLNSISSSYLDTLMYTKIQKLCSKILISQVILNFQTDLVIIWVSPQNFVCHTVVWQMRWWWWNNCVTKIADCATEESSDDTCLCTLCTRYTLNDARWKLKSQEKFLN